MLGDLPQDFLRIQLVQAQIFDPTGHGMRQQGYGSAPHPQQLQQNPNFLGYFTLTIAEVCPSIYFVQLTEEIQFAFSCRRS